MKTVEELWLSGDHVDKLLLPVMVVCTFVVAQEEVTLVEDDVDASWLVVVFE